MCQKELKLFVRQTVIDIAVISSKLAGEETATIHVSAYNSARGPYAIFLNDQMPSYAEPTGGINFF